MQLIINSPGAYLHRKDAMFEVRTSEKETRISVNKVTSIIISTSASVSTDALKMAIEHNIDLILIDKFGDPYGRLWHCKPSSTTLIRRRQLEIAETDEGLLFAICWVKCKLENQIDFLLQLRDRRTRSSAAITSTINKLREAVGRLLSLQGNVNERRDEIMGIEGYCGRAYFAMLSDLMPEKFSFAGRSRNPAKDQFNCYLNYCYGVLYGLVERACLLAGLDPFIGLLHTDNYNKRSLVFDLIENYRIWADETVFSLFSDHKIEDGHFRRLENGYILEKDGKALLLTEFNTFLDKTIKYRHRNIKRRDTIQHECHIFANSLIGRTDTL